MVFPMERKIKHATRQHLAHDGLDEDLYKYNIFHDDFNGKKERNEMEKFMYWVSSKLIFAFLFQARIFNAHLRFGTFTWRQHLQIQSFHPESRFFGAHRTSFRHLFVKKVHFSNAISTI
jgi:hypothetical protein